MRAGIDHTFNNGTMTQILLDLLGREMENLLLNMKVLLSVNSDFIVITIMDDLLGKIFSLLIPES